MISVYLRPVPFIALLGIACYAAILFRSPELMRWWARFFSAKAHALEVYREVFNSKMKGKQWPNESYLREPR